MPNNVIQFPIIPRPTGAPTHPSSTGRRPLSSEVYARRPAGRPTHRDSAECPVHHDDARERIEVKRITTMQFLKLMHQPNARRKIPIADRVRRRLEIDPVHGCHIWQGATTPFGYGLIRNGTGVRTCHRVAYEEANGSIPLGMVVRHTCDRPACCNPKHLVLGTQADNRRDAAIRGRAGGARRKLTAESVREIRASTGTCKEIGKRFGVSGCTVSEIRNGKLHRHTK